MVRLVRRRALTSSPFAFRATGGKALIGGGHADRLVGDKRGDGLQIARGIVQKLTPLGEAGLFGGHGVVRMRAVKARPAGGCRIRLKQCCAPAARPES